LTAEISIVIPTHNRPHLLPRAVESARESGTNVEIIVVDDASRDETASVCRSLAGIKYVRLERNQGVAGARNVGILESTGEYIAFLDDDDRRLPGSLDLQLKALKENPDAAFCCGAMIMADQDYQPTGEVIRPRHFGPDIFWELLELDFPVMPLCTLIRKDCLLAVGLLNQRLNGIDDWDIFTRLAEINPVIVLNEPMGIYRQPNPRSRQGSSSQSRQLRRAARHQLSLLKLPRALGATSSQRRLIRRRALNRIADTLLLRAIGLFASGEIAAACENMLSALQLNPSRALRPRNYKKLAGRILFKPC
jgi:glycosyltransferase involved in cell wall biosynthesis